LHDKPADIDAVTYKSKDSVAKPAMKTDIEINHFQAIVLSVAMVFLGFAGNFCSGQSANLYITAGFDAMQVSYMMSAYGICIIIGKFVLCQMADMRGGFASNLVFGLIGIAGSALNCLADLRNSALAFCGMTLMAVGLAIGTAGISINSLYFFKSEDLASAMKTNQTFFMFGGVLSGYIPGIIADRCGSFVPSAVICMCSLVVYVSITSMIYIRKEQ